MLISRRFKATKTVYETFLKTGEQGGFSTVFTPPSAETTIITAKLVEENAPVQETISVGVTESLLPLLLIAILLGIAIFIIISSWAYKPLQKDNLKWIIFLAVIPIILAYIILARFPIYDVGGNSAIAAALITPIAGYLIGLFKGDDKPK